MTSRPEYFLAESKGFIMCIDRRDLMVADTSSVKLGDLVKFKYGVEVFDGTISFMTASEEAALAEMKVQSKSKRPSKPSSSGPNSESRIGIREKMCAPVSNVKPTVASTSKCKAKNAAKIIAKKSKDKAEAYLDDQLASSARDDEQSDASITSSNHSDCRENTISKKQGKLKDIRKVRQSCIAVCEQSACEILKTNTINNNSLSDVRIIDQETLSKEEETGDDLKRKAVSDECDPAEISLSKKKRTKIRKLAGNKLRRNLHIYKSPNGSTFLHSKDTPNAVQIHPSYDVYTLKNVLEKALNSSKSASICCQYLLDYVYTEDALKNASAFGYPPRGKGSNALSQDKVLPRLHPDGLDSIIARTLEHQVVNKTWRPKMTESQLRNSITNKVSLSKKTYAPSDSDDGKSSSALSDN